MVSSVAVHSLDIFCGLGEGENVRIYFCHGLVAESEAFDFEDGAFVGFPYGDWALED